VSFSEVEDDGAGRLELEDDEGAEASTVDDLEIVGNFMTVGEADDDVLVGEEGTGV
jgi:hypothetical protein